MNRFFCVKSSLTLDAGYRNLEAIFKFFEVGYRIPSSIPTSIWFDSGFNYFEVSFNENEDGIIHIVKLDIQDIISIFIKFEVNFNPWSRKQVLMEVGFIGVDIAAVFTITLQITNYKWQPVLNEFCSVKLTSIWFNSDFNYFEDDFLLLLKLDIDSNFNHLKMTSMNHDSIFNNSVSDFRWRWLQDFRIRRQV